MKKLKYRLDRIRPSAAPVLSNPSPQHVDPLPDLDWCGVILPSTPQKHGSCGAQGTCNGLEALYRWQQGRDVIHTGYQMDAEKLYWSARTTYYPDRKKEDEGLQADEAAKEAIRLGWVPPDTKLLHVQPSIPEMYAALQKGPILQGLLIGDAWDPANIDADGFLHPIPVTPATAWGGHLTVIIGYQYRNGFHHWRFLNSWARWGWHGQGIMRHEMVVDGLRYMGGNNLVLLHPGPQFKDWSIPKTALIKES